MNTAEFKAAFAIADNPNITLYPNEDISIFDGYGLPSFQPIVATLRQVAALMRWQAGYIFSRENGSKWNSEELTAIRRLLRHKVTIAETCT